MEFKTKKSKDFVDFKIITKVIYNGAHKKDEIKSLILKLSYTMNNYRFSTGSGAAEKLSNNELNKLLNATPTIEYLNDGRVRDIETKKIISQQISSVYEIVKPDGEVLILQTLSDAAVAIGVDSGTLSRHLDVEALEGRLVILKGNKVKRIAVYSPKVA